MNKIEIQTTNKVRTIKSQKEMFQELFVNTSGIDIKHIVEDKILKNTNFGRLHE